METYFLVIFIFLFLQRFGSSSNTMMMITSLKVKCVESERLSMLIFKQNIIDKANRLSTWTGIECCEWQGVQCDRRNGHVVKLDLRTHPGSITWETIYPDNWLVGEVSPSLLNLTYLQYLDLSVNNFSGQIPEFLGSFKRLEYLNLSCSGFSGLVPHHLGNLSRLQYLDLNNRRNLFLQPKNLYSYAAFWPESKWAHFFDINSFLKTDMLWLSSLSTLKHLDISGITIGDDVDWFNPVNMLPSLLTLNLAHCDINIPSVSFVNFTSLNSLDLSANFINSTIPFWLSNLTSLKHLYLHNNYFHGQIPDFLGTFTALASIDLSANSFDTRIPDLLWNLSSLVLLDLSSNTFYGSVPRNVKLHNLGVLDLSNNRFVGDLSSLIGNESDSFSKKIGHFKNLEYLLLSRNSFSSLPPSLCSLSSLKVMDVSGNGLNGSIPTSVGLFSMLEKLDLNGNYLSGSIPTSFGLLSRLKYLDLSHNQLSGNIPTSFGQLSKLETIYVSHNSLVGILSEIHFTKLKNLTDLILSSNSLVLNVSSRWIPPFQLQHFGIRSGNIGPRFPAWLQTQANLKDLDLSSSGIKDTIPEWFENVSSNIYYLDLSHNQIGGKLPRFHGSTSIGKYLMMNSNKFEGSFTSFPSNLRMLDLSDNLLSGHFPHIDGILNLDGVDVLNLSKNRFTGSVPVHLCKMPWIEVLDLSQNEFSGMLPGCLGNLQRLRAMSISKNRLTGNIPVQLCKMPWIEVLDLSQNRFSGRLPGCLGNLNTLEVLDLKSNTITGDVPSSLGSLKNLRSLHLHDNRFKGDIPLSLQNLTELIIMDVGNNMFMGNIPVWIGEKLLNLRFLNLQSNKFTGKIPFQLCHLNALQLLNLAHNNISGTIPRCLGNFSGMIRDNVDYNDIAFYEENILASLKGIQLLYTKTIPFLTSLDLSSNNLIGEIPDVLMNLVGLKNLNLSGNMLKGHVPTTIGNLKQMESLDLSMNRLSGRIPPSLSSLNFLSYLNLSFNNLSGAIPVGNQLQTLNNPSIYEGNNRLCGPPILRSCNTNELSFNHSEDEGQDDTEGLWLYAGMGPGFVVYLVVCTSSGVGEWLTLRFFRTFTVG